MENKTIIYTMHNCIYCISQKKWMETNHFQYEERNIIKSADYEQEFRDLNGTGTPLTIVYGKDGKKTTVMGFNQERLESLLVKS
ncbi:glutaredoxin family protein [Priestia aryabhattai]|uniref:glutaredoxin family protein n=1 Tax=Priestia aryabhattai TaxID=412384 RepID=UPI002E1D47B0|nr:glutaredoxin domain-containing protein [Priestia aryabhattai]MED4156667.1 glutaredoxin domain-containing protein [Priestia aryabhattai]